MAVVHLTTDNFNKEVLNSEKPVLIDFWAGWCGPCQMLSPIIEEVANEVTDTKICKINVDEQPALAGQFNIMSIPTLVVVKDGKVTDKNIGFISKERTLELINN